jgi:hypothetical protein
MNKIVILEYGCQPVISLQRGYGNMLNTSTSTSFPTLLPMERSRTLCAKLGTAASHIWSLPTGSCGYALRRKLWNRRMSDIA